MGDRAPFTAKDANELAGLSYRQLNDWDARGALPGERDREGAWRTFTLRQLFALMVCNELRRLYGIPVDKLRFVNDCMIEKGTDRFTAATRFMEQGLRVFLLTDLEETFVMKSDLEIADLMRDGYFRGERPMRPYILLRLDEIVNRLLGALPESSCLTPHNDGYRLAAQIAAVTAVRTMPEMDLLQAIRSGKFDRIAVQVRDGLIRFLNAEGNVEGHDIVVEGDAVNVKRKAAFETFSFTACDGQIVKARRELPKKYTDADNEPRLFAPIVRAEREQLKRSRDGGQPSDVAKTQTTTRRDRKPLSRENHARKRARVPDAQPRKMPTGTRR